MPKLLGHEELRKELARLEGWREEGDFMAKDFEFESFMEGIGFVNSVAEVAEELDHHPDIGVRYTRVSLRLQTHSEGGVTRRDVRLAEEIDRLVLHPGPS